MRPIDDTHDPSRRSWVASANGETDFPIQNLPLGVFTRTDAREPPRVGVAIGDGVLDLARCVDLGLLDTLSADVRAAVSGGSLNPLAALGPGAMGPLRRRVAQLLDADGRHAEPSAVVPLSDVTPWLPFAIGDYSDFYTSIDHATNVGHMFRSGDPLFPNFRHMPVGYHGRSSSIVVSGEPVRRPAGQRRAPGDDAPSAGPSERLDYELEVGAFVGPGNAWGTPVPLAQADDHVFGLCLLNDWSARDIQVWESQPLGPFLAKSFATTISPWVVTLEALAPFRAPARARGADAPPLLPYLEDPSVAAWGAIDIDLSVWLSSAAMRERRVPAHRVSRNRFRDMYWTIAQMLAHHTSNGCNLRPGDLLGGGTVSGPDAGTAGCLLEMTRHDPVVLPTGETRRFLEDGDEVVLRGRCARDGFVPIGFGACGGTIVAGPAPAR